MNERGRERDGKREQKSEREKLEEKNNSLSIQYSFFPHNLCFHGNHTIGKEMEGVYRCIEKEWKKHNRSGLQVMRVHVSSLICGALPPS